MSRRLAAAVVAASTMALALFVNPAPALATSAWGCNYPYACVYSGPMDASGIVGRFRDVTSDWQRLANPRFGDLSIVNTRNDDVVYFLYAHVGWPQQTGCVLPNQNIGWYGTLYAIRIDSDNFCQGLNPA
ncbi:hypothetical protein ACQP2F_13590 [Actinoplanes sp. CA-030573]|uniref:hypothetical protein n=1 Tax=Actinoplanes sp. CA-030573 TaxID=3239898 RepID=UPI003D94E6AA